MLWDLELIYIYIPWPIASVGIKYTYMPHTNQEGKFTSPMAVWVSISRSTAFGIFDSKLVSSSYYLEGKGFLPIRMVSFDRFQG